MIDAWHRDRGWAKIGYHFVVLDNRRAQWWRDGEVQQGRSLGKIGAHCLGLNERSVGVCVVGHGDRRPWTYPQRVSVVYLCARLCKRYGMPVEHVLGHREVSTLADKGIIHAKHRPDTRCPGMLIHMDGVRQQIAKVIESRCA
jgi:N-acetylmuramoyl-L-alanine amidase